MKTTIRFLKNVLGCVLSLLFNSPQPTVYMGKRGIKRRRVVRGFGWVMVVWYEDGVMVKVEKRVFKDSW